MHKRVSVIIPTLNAEKYLEKQLQMLSIQTVKPDEILVVDSESTDRTGKIAAKAAVRFITVARKEFDHGGTRDMALRKTQGDIVVFMTQDALPVNEYLIENLIRPFEDPQVAVVGGRQIAYPDARPFEKAVRARNYPNEERKWSKEDVARLGVRAFTISDVCAAYRREAYLDADGFDHPILTNEDMLMAEKFLHKGYKLVYSAKASVYHSHRFTLKQEYRRNYMIGRTMKRYEARFDYISELGTGVQFFKDVVCTLVRGRHYAECVFFALNCAARLLGNRMGRYDEGKGA